MRIAVFSSSSLAGGLAQAGWMLVASRAIQGVGAALAAPSSLALLTTIFPEGPQRVRAIGLYTTVSATGGAIGLLAGGLLTQFVSWRWVMFVNVPIGLLIWTLGRLALVETDTWPVRLDLVGAATSTLGMIGIVLGLVEAGSAGWTKPVTVGSLMTGLVLLWVFVRNERSVEEPILPIRLLTHRTRSAANLGRGLVYSGMYGMFFFMTQFLQDIQNYSPLRAGVAFLPLPASVFLASQLASRVLVKRLPTKSLMISGIGLSTVGLALSTGLNASSPYVHMLGVFVLLGLGMGMSFVSLTSASLADVEPHDAGAASGLINVAQQTGGALGIAVLVTVFGAVTSHLELAQTGTQAGAQLLALAVHGMDVVFRVSVLFALTALVTVAVFVRRSPEPLTAHADEANQKSDVDFAGEPALVSVPVAIHEEALHQNVPRPAFALCDQSETSSVA